MNYISLDPGPCLLQSSPRLLFRVWAERRHCQSSNLVQDFWRVTWSTVSINSTEFRISRPRVYYMKENSSMFTLSLSHEEWSARQRVSHGSLNLKQIDEKIERYWNILVCFSSPLLIPKQAKTRRIFSASEFLLFFSARKCLTWSFRIGQLLQFSFCTVFEVHREGCLPWSCSLTLPCFHFEPGPCLAVLVLKNFWGRIGNRMHDKSSTPTTRLQ